MGAVRTLIFTCSVPVNATPGDHEALAYAMFAFATRTGLILALLAAAGAVAIPNAVVASTVTSVQRAATRADKEKLIFAPRRHLAGESTGAV